MGAWDYGPFDNDGAGDVIADLRDGSAADIVDSLTSVMTEVADTEEYIDNFDAQQAVAAAVLVAARLGAEVTDRSATSLLETHPFTVEAGLRALALRTLDRIAEPEDNEWHYLWNDAGALDKATALLRPYREALAAGE